MKVFNTYKINQNYKKKYFLKYHLKIMKLLITGFDGYIGKHIVSSPRAKNIDYKNTIK